MWTHEEDCQPHRSDQGIPVSPEELTHGVVASSEKSATRFIDMWKVRNRISARPEMLMTSLRPIEDLINHDIKLLFN